MRLLTTTALLLSAPTWAMAEDILVRADISAATVFASGAEVTRAVTADLPAGTHRVIIPMRDLHQLDLLQASGPDGIQIGQPQPIDDWPLEEGALDSEAEAAARSDVETAETALESAQDDLARRNAEIRGLETQMAYLNGLARGGDTGSTMPEDPAVLTQLLSTLGTETARIGGELQTAREGRRALEEAVEDRQDNLEVARRALSDLRPFGTETPAVAVDVTVPEAMEVALELTYLTFQATWTPSYALDLDSETGALDIERLIQFGYFGPAPWRDVAMRFSTANPTRQREPSQLFPAPARIQPPAPSAPAPVFDQTQGFFAPEQEVIDGRALIAGAAPATLETNGLSLVYTYTAPVTVSTGGTATLTLDTLGFEMDLENRAVPRRDQTAFLVAMGDNESGEPLLPGEALMYRDGDLIGSGYMPLIADGAEMEMAFGPLDHLRLTWQDLSLDEGDRGVFVTSNEQRRVVMFGVENTSGSDETVRLLYATPFAEQEDLELDIDLSIAPDDRDIDDLRGVQAWDLDLPAGEEVQIEMTIELNWPEDQVLDWQP